MFDTSIFFSQVEAGLDKVFTVEIENSRFSSLSYCGIELLLNSSCWLQADWVL